MPRRHVNQLGERRLICLYKTFCLKNCFSFHCEKLFRSAATLNIGTSCPAHASQLGRTILALISLNFLITHNSRFR